MTRKTKRYPDREECLNMLAQVECPKQVIRHILTVTELALKIAKRFPKVDLELLEAGALLHDIGRSRTHGVTHGVEGGQIARELGLSDDIIKIIERHLGAGIVKEDAEKLELPSKDFIPKTLEERIVAHADNLIEGNKRVKIKRSLQILDGKGLSTVAERVRQLHVELSKEAGIDLDEV